MHSAAHRSVTVVTLMTLIFTPMLKGHHWVNVLTGKTTETTIEQCKPGTRARPESTSRRRSSSRSRSSRLSHLTLILAIFLVAFDFQNLLSWWGGRTIKPGDAASTDFTIIVPLFGHPRYFDGRRDLLRYQRHVLVAIEVSPRVMADFADQLEEEGWRVARLLVESPNPAELLKASLPAVTTTYALRLDADTSIGDDLGRAVAAVAARGAEICSIKCAVANRQNVVTNLQALEYRMAMLARHFRPWLTSGACFLARTDSLRLIMDRHSLWTPGEDIETGRTALALRMRIHHLDITVETDAPDTWQALVKTAETLVGGHVPPLVDQPGSESPPPTRPDRGTTSSPSASRCTRSGGR